MRKVTQRAAAVSAAVLGVALIGTGCSTEKEKGSEAPSSASSVASSTTSVVTAPDERHLVRELGKRVRRLG